MIVWHWRNFFNDDEEGWEEEDGDQNIDHHNQTKKLSSRVISQYFSQAISPLSQVLDVEAAIQQRKSEVKNFLDISTQCFSVKINVFLKIYFSPGGEADTGDEDCQPWVAHHFAPRRVKSLFRWWEFLIESINNNIFLPYYSDSLQFLNDIWHLHF